MSEGIEAGLAKAFELLLPHLDERQRRLVLGAAARVRGYGGIRLVAGAAGVAESTVSRGLRELEQGGEPDGRVRGRARAASGCGTLIRNWSRPCWRWSSRTSGEIRSLHCGGR